MRRDHAVGMGLEGQAVAAFDVDNTLTRGDAFLPFVREVVGTRAFVRTMALMGVTALRTRVDRDAMKTSVVAALAGHDEGAIREIGSRHAEELYRRWLRPHVVGQLDAHRRAGHRVVLVSASLDVYVEPLAALLGADTVLCSRLEVDGGRLTGRLDGRNCRSAEKVTRLAELLDDAAVLWAYGDSRDDLPMLRLADHPVWVAGNALVEASGLGGLSRRPRRRAARSMPPPPSP
jgi:phosphatidylglycerophosphatase C